MESNLVCYHKSDNKIGRPFIMSEITDRIGQHEFFNYQLIIKITISEKRRIFQPSYERKGNLMAIKHQKLKGKRALTCR